MAVLVQFGNHSVHAPKAFRLAVCGQWNTVKHASPSSISTGLKPNGILKKPHEDQSIVVVGDYLLYLRWARP